MLLKFFKYQGAGNDFILIDNREKKNSLNVQQIQYLCDRHFGIGADGLMLLEHSDIADFKMIYFNSDGNESTMCGNGGRCITAFAKKLGIIRNTATFEAIDGLHSAEILNDQQVRLKMQDVSEIKILNGDFVLNTGSPHYVQIVENIQNVNVYEYGRKIRNSEPFCKEGINVNFVEVKDKNNILVRTYERGVENETLACGTGITAAALITAKIHHSEQDKIFVTTPGGKLQVEFEWNNHQYQNIFLTGNARYVFYGEIEI